MMRKTKIAFTTALLCLSCLQPASAQTSREYTEDRPLIIVLSLIHI